MSLGKVSTTEKREAVFVKQGLADTTFRMSVALNVLLLDFTIEVPGAGFKKSVFGSGAG